VVDPVVHSTPEEGDDPFSQIELFEEEEEEGAVEPDIEAEQRKRSKTDAAEDYVVEMRPRRTASCAQHRR